MLKIKEYERPFEIFLVVEKLSYVDSKYKKLLLIYQLLLLGSNENYEIEVEEKVVTFLHSNILNILYFFLTLLVFWVLN